jgi:hypothetical protein
MTSDKEFEDTRPSTTLSEFASSPAGILQVWHLCFWFSVDMEDPFSLKRAASCIYALIAS